MSAPLPPPTPELRRWVQRLGPDGTLRLIETHGGTRLYVPKSANATDLAGELGADLLAALVAWRPGEHVMVPVARDWRAQVYQARGESYAQIARRLCMTENGVWAILNRSGLTGAGRPAKVQLSLFND